MDLQKIKSILIVCSGNICRSPMAEGVLRYKFTQENIPHIRINSAGITGWDNQQPTFEAIRVCAEIGIDISSLRSKPISKQMINSADLTLAMTKHHINQLLNYYDAQVDKTLLLGSFDIDNPGIEIGDPYRMPIEYYRKILKQIIKCANGLIEKLNTSIKNKNNNITCKTLPDKGM